MTIPPSPPDNFPPRGAGIWALVLRDEPVQFGHDILQSGVDIAPEGGQLDPVQLSVEIGVNLVHGPSPVHFLGVMEVGEGQRRSTEVVKGQCMQEIESDTTK